MAAPADGVDRISALPDDLLRDVVSRLPVRDGARTAALATRWRGLWRSTPIVLRDADLLPASSAEDKAARAAAFAAVGRILADHPGPFRKVQLTCCDFGSHQREIVEWARLLATKGVQELHLLDVDDPAQARVQRLPADILSCASLEYLSLSSWRFPCTSTDVVFPYLKKLSVEHTNMRDEDLDHMLSCSPVLEILALILSQFPGRIRLRSQSLKCMLLWMYFAEEVAVVDAPCLQRLILWMAWAGNVRGDHRPLMVKIHRAPNLCELGFLEPRLHQLQIGNIIINAETKASPSSIVPSVKTLALKLSFDAFDEVKMLPSFLRCFPNVETLHIESSILCEATARPHANFWPEVLPIECLKSHVKKIVIHKFRGGRNEFEFLKFIAKGARKLQDLVLVMPKEVSASAAQSTDLNTRLRMVLRTWTWTWAAADPKWILLGTTVDNACTFSTASDLSVNDPFM